MGYIESNLLAGEHVVYKAHLHRIIFVKPLLVIVLGLVLLAVEPRVGGLVCLLTYFGLMTIPSRYLFGVTSVLIAFLAAGMAAQAIAFLEQANAVTALGTIVWDSSWLLSDHSILGRAFHTLIGYSDQPTAMQLLVYATTLAVTFALMKLFAPERVRHAPAE